MTGSEYTATELRTVRRLVVVMAVALAAAVASAVVAVASDYLWLAVVLWVVSAVLGLSGVRRLLRLLAQHDLDRL